VPLDALESKFAHMRFEPAGWTGNPDIPNAKSVVDYIFRWLGIQFIPGYREANTPKREGAAATKSAAEGSEGDSAEPNANTAADVVRELTAIASAVNNGQGSTTNTLTGNELQLAEDGQTPQVRSKQFANFQADAPGCDNCGAITVRNGNCYLCHNCGNSMGCS
jgi:ribonucleoside-diphosphate reductase alpha chain